MKIFGRCVALLIVAAIFIGALILVGKTSWADGQREKINRFRAERRAKMEGQERREGAPPTSALPDRNAEKSAENVDKKAEKPEKGTSENVAENRAKDVPEKKANDALSGPQKEGEKGENGPSRKSGPPVKPPQFSGVAFAQGGEFLLKLVVSALISGGILAFARRRSKLSTAS